MFSPVSPQFVYMIQKEKERDLEREIELARVARERGTSEQPQAWYAQAAQWVNTMFFHRAPVQMQPVADPCNCQGVPC